MKNATPNTNLQSLQNDFGLTWPQAALLYEPDEHREFWHGTIVDGDGTDVAFDGFATRGDAIVWLCETACVMTDNICGLT